MRKKVGITIDVDLYKKVKLYCAKNDVRISELFEYSVEMYLERMETLEEEMKNRELGGFIEDNYTEIVKQSVNVNEIGPEE